MSTSPAQLPTSNITMLHQASRVALAPVVDTAGPMSSTYFTLQDRHDITCTQTVEVPVWYGVDYNTCSMQTTTAPCFVSFPANLCHTARPGQRQELYGMSGSLKLWVVIGAAIFLTIIIPVTILWLRWKLSAPRRGGKRSISVQLEKVEAKNASKAKSGSSSSANTNSKPKFPKTSGNKQEPKAPNGGRNIQNRLLGRNRGSQADNPGDIRITKNININGRRSDHHVDQKQDIDRPPPVSPRIALESLPPNHPLRLPENQPWMQQDQNGRWVRREEGYLHPGLPPPLHQRNGESNNGRTGRGEGARGERMYVPGGWPQ